jgi:hypothetical protein
MTIVPAARTISVTRRRSIRRHLTTAYARDRVRAALYEVVVDAVEFGPCSLQAQAGRDWLRAAIARPLDASTEAALTALAGEFDRAFDGAPPEVRAWLEASVD